MPSTDLIYNPLLSLQLFLLFLIPGLLPVGLHPKLIPGQIGMLTAAPSGDFSANLGSVFPGRRPAKRDLSMFRTPSGKFYCSLCNMAMNTEQQMALHVETKKHKLCHSLHKQSTTSGDVGSDDGSR